MIKIDNKKNKKETLLKDLKDLTWMEIKNKEQKKTLISQINWLLKKKTTSMKIIEKNNLVKPPIKLADLFIKTEENQTEISTSKIKNNRVIIFDVILLLLSSFFVSFILSFIIYYLFDFSIKGLYAFYEVLPMLLILCYYFIIWLFSD
jgi:hypothetical protein